MCTCLCMCAEKNGVNSDICFPFLIILQRFFFLSSNRSKCQEGGFKSNLDLPRLMVVLCYNTFIYICDLHEL